MEYSINPGGVAGVVSDTQASIDGLDQMLALTDEAESSASTAFQYSPQTSSAVRSCLEHYVAQQILVSRDYAQTTITSTVGACNAYTGGDSQMSSDARSALSSLTQLDLPGVLRNGFGF
ncbi:DUF6507 family protein [Dermabacter hominis]|uniref:DUF6507 family protein n=1 Tax=Dermabacter hominis TaxID=36740 RepID=UPI00223AF499|nr:DUF6507 family protein [Dermabacter hominis]MCT2025371.1 DUF6507 family protein [Dermabacter hominis]